jgi:hypothetical protein
MQTDKLSGKLWEKTSGGMSVHSWVSRLFQGRAQWLFGNKTVAHVDPYPFFVLPSDIIFGVAIKIRRILLGFGGRFVCSIVGP